MLRAGDGPDEINVTDPNDPQEAGKVAENRGRDVAGTPRPPAKRQLLRILPLAVLAAGFALFFILGLERELSLESLRAHQADLLARVAAHGVAAALIFVVIYVAVVAFSVPAAAPLTLAGGFLFGVWEGGGLTVIAATIGATIVFLATRTALAGPIRARAGPRIRAMEDGFRKNAFNYLLALRLVPVFPFFLVNLAAGLLGMRLAPYVLATLIGIVPASFVYAGLGSGLGTIFENGGSPDPGIILRPALLLPLLGLAALSLLPVLWRRLRESRPFSR